MSFEDNDDPQTPEDHQTHLPTTHSPHPSVEDDSLAHPQMSDAFFNPFSHVHPDSLDINVYALETGHYQDTNSVDFEPSGPAQGIIIGGTQSYPSASNNTLQSPNLVSPHNGYLNNPESSHFMDNTISPSTPPLSNPPLRPLAPAPSLSARALSLGFLPQPSISLSASMASATPQPFHLELTLGPSLSSFTPDAGTSQQPASSHPARIKLYDDEYRNIKERLLNKPWYPKATQAVEPKVLPNDEFVLAGLILPNAKTRFQALVYSASKKQHYCRIKHPTWVENESGPCEYKAQEIKDVVAHVCEYLQYSPYECEIQHGDKKCTEKFTTVQRRNDHHYREEKKLKLPQGGLPKIECRVCQKKVLPRNERRHFEHAHPEELDPGYAKQMKRRRVTRLQPDLQE
ncbi:hypothetical protein M408DRAFT_270343 [Serendipita vermifera MAFF 305830]|uniref:Uncharacterized protein n=1 Tax=Serendipita vermifera MAFF 305830 TaxID=933852 RepID=A0A0C2XP93_SERVB|nr:hypothetical protein M408DRAFT_270343 [Serendipita vermifera MAFF 305830]